MILGMGHCKKNFYLFVVIIRPLAKVLLFIFFFAPLRLCVRKKIFMQEVYSHNPKSKILFMGADK
jgi:hypothetical protein